MARYEATIATPKSRQDAFGYMSDMRNFERWDPGIKSSTQTRGSGPGFGAEYTIEMSAITLHYNTVQHEPPHRTKFEAHSKLLSSYDTIEVTDAPGGGSAVRYVAIVDLSGPLKLVDPLFGIIFNRIGDKAAAGMAEALGGTQVK